MSKLAKTLGVNVRAERERQRLTQVGLAERAGLSEEWVRRIERGKASPSLDTLEALGTALACPPGVLLAPTVASEAADRLAALIVGMTTPELEWLDACVALARTLKAKV